MKRVYNPAAEDEAKKQRIYGQGYSFSSAFGTGIPGNSYRPAIIQTNLALQTVQPSPYVASAYGLNQQSVTSQYGMYANGYNAMSYPTVAVTRNVPIVPRPQQYANPTTQYNYQQMVQSNYVAPTAQSMYGQVYATQYDPSYQAAQPVNPLNRTIYIGNFPPRSTFESLLSQVKGGMIESCRILPEKNCAFLSFVDGYGASLFHQQFGAAGIPLLIDGVKVTVGWGKPSPLPTNVSNAIQQGATRCVYIGSIEDSWTQEFFNQELSKFGDIDMIKIVPDKNIAFVHFANLMSAYKCVTDLASDPTFSGKRVNYGKDRSDAPVNGQKSTNSISTNTFEIGGPMNAESINHRQIYLGSLADGTTTSDICNVVRGGQLILVKLMAEKNCAFVTFAEAKSAHMFLNYCHTVGCFVKSRRIKANWGKPQPLKPQEQVALSKGASRNVYLPAINENITEDKLRQDFEVFGELEQVHIIPEQGCGFVNFTSLTAAVKAFETLCMDPTYASLNMRYGRDRCSHSFRPHSNRSHSGSAQQPQPFDTTLEQL